MPHIGPLPSLSRIEKDPTQEKISADKKKINQEKKHCICSSQYQQAACTTKAKHALTCFVQQNKTTKKSRKMKMLPFFAKKLLPKDGSKRKKKPVVECPLI
jgi:hypothetical protein